MKRLENIELEPHRDDAGELLGTRLRHARLTRGLRLKDVAANVPCSESLISKIERGHANPSLKVLHRLAKVLDLSIAALFSPGDEIGSIISHAGRRAVITLEGTRGKGRIHLENIVSHAARLLEGNIHIVEPGAESDGAIEHEGEEVGYLLQGKLELWVDQERYELGPGDSFQFRSELRHRYRNPGTEITKVLWINTPPTF